MRLFVAVEVPEPVRRELRRRTAGLRERLPRARWVNPEVLHLTLLFLGEVAAERAAELAGALRLAFAPFPPLPLRLAGGGTFPPGRPARVAWVGVTAPPELLPLQAAVERAARGLLDLPPDDRPYRPHVTLARCPSPWPRRAAEAFAGTFPAEVGPPFVARHGVLVESRLVPRGATYRDLAELPLAGDAEDTEGQAGPAADAGDRDGGGGAPGRGHAGGGE